MTDHRTAIREAASIYKRRATLDTAQQNEAIALLASHGVWSRRHIVSITGASMWHVGKDSTKTDKKGGRFNPETLDDISEIIKEKDRGELDRTRFVRVVQAGTSAYMIAILVGIPISSVKRYAGLDRKEAA